jgi:hypothetical protein
MLNKSETQKALDKFKNSIIKESRKNLTNLKKNSSKKLYTSLRGRVLLMPNSFSMDFFMVDYGHFQDKGVNGVGPAGKDRFGKLKKVIKDGKYNFGTGSGPTGGLRRGLDKWMTRKGIAPRNEKGKFVSRKTLKFLIARSIFRHGIKPSLFFTKPFESAFSKLPAELIEKFGLDSINLFNLTIQQPKIK